jgi:MFS transporter, AAHS family, benzoate transport protein
MTDGKSGVSGAQFSVNKWIDDSKFISFHGAIVAICFLIVMSDGYDLFIYGATVPSLMREFKLTPPQAGVIGSYALIGAAIGAFVFGSLADKIGRKLTIMVCATLFSVATFCTGLTNGPDAFGATRFIAGLGIGGSLPNLIALTSEYAPARNRALSVATIMSGMVFGGIVSALLSLWLITAFGWRAVYYAASAPIILIPLVYMFVPESPVHLLRRNQIDTLRQVLQRARPQDLLPAGVELTIAQGSGRSPIVDLFCESRGFSTLCMWGIYFLSLYMIYGLGVWLPKLMMDAGFSLGSGLWFMLALNLGAFIATQIAGYVADRFGRRATIFVCFIITFASIALLASTRDFVLLTILVALAGAGNNCAQNIAHSYVSLYYPPTMRSTAMGFALGIGRFGAIFGPAITGFVMVFTTSVNVLFLSMAVPGIVAAILILLVRDNHSFTPDSTRLGAFAGRLGNEPSKAAT